MHFGFGGLGMILFWVLVIAAIFVLVKVISGSSGDGKSGSENTLDVLKKRYAAGELSRDDFERMKRELVDQ